MKPIEFEHANKKYTGGNGGDLPVNRVVHRDGTVVQLSIWQGSWYERLSFLLNGKIRVMVQGEKMPKFAIGAGIEKVMRFDHGEA